MRGFNELVASIASIDTRTKKTAGRAVDRLLTLRNWVIGACLVEYEQHGEDRAAYGERLMPELARALRAAGHKGLQLSNLKNCRQVALAWPGLDIRQTPSGVFPPEPVGAAIRQTPSGGSSGGSGALCRLLDGVELSFAALAERDARSGRLEWQDQAWLQQLFASLSFSHLLELSRIGDPVKRAFYELECLRSGWSVRELRRQQDSMLFERVGLSRDKKAIIAMAQEGILVDAPSTLVRDPYVFEFLDIRSRPEWTESELEQALIDHLQQFIHELGRDFCFVERQFRITVGGRHHYLDLLFYHRSLRCLVAVDLKLGAFRHEYAGQMNFYLNYITENMVHPDESPPVGLLLCADKDVAEVHYATAGLSRSIFVSRYLMKLPSEEQLRRWLEEEHALLAARRDALS